MSVYETKWKEVFIAARDALSVAGTAVYTAPARIRSLNAKDE